MAKNDDGCENLLSSLIPEIKSYSGKDPLLPWIRGIKKMKENLPHQILNEKLPRFLQKCVQSFESDKRYRNDSRYIRVWLQLMDFVEDPRALLRTMEANCIGTKRSLFYQAYALYYEKMKKFEEAEKMYHLGVQNLAEPMDELQKSYDQFLSRMEKHKKKSMQRHGSETAKTPLSEKNILVESDDSNWNKENMEFVKSSLESNLPKVRKSEAELNTINMFNRRAQRSQHEEKQCFNNGFEVSVDENFRSEVTSKEKTNSGSNWASRPNPESVKIFIDDENSYETTEESDEKGFVFLCPKDQSSETSEETDRGSPPRARFREDTVVHRFVGSTISDEPEVENVCHHGLVDPTVNLKEAMKDINNMFGEPIEFTRPKQSKKRDKPEEEPSGGSGGFMIYEDEVEHQKGQPSQMKLSQHDDLFEPTICTKEAADEINKLFSIPMDDM